MAHGLHLLRAVPIRSLTRFGHVRVSGGAMSDRLSTHGFRGFVSAACRVRAAALLMWLAPNVVFAQAAITGVVKDPSGAVLPGVTVEAASPALIEKTRSAVTDGSGQYRIIDLRPGTYA